MRKRFAGLSSRGERKARMADHISVLMGLDPYNPEDVDACMDVFDELGSTTEVCEAAGCCYATLVRYINKGVIKSYRFKKKVGDTACGGITTVPEEGVGFRYYYPKKEVIEVVRKTITKNKKDWPYWNKNHDGTVR